MKKNNIGYLLREGFRGVFLHGFMSFAAICVTVACLIIMGSFCLILYNTSAMVKELEQENEMLVYIDESYSEAKAKSVGSQINLITNVRSATFVSRHQALDDFVETLNDPDAFAGLDPDTLRDRYVVTVEDNSLLKQTYDKFHKKGFEIYGVSFDRDRDKWLAAVKDNGMEWIHVSELQRFDNQAAKDYAVQGIPSNFLIDAQGRIVAKNLRGEDLSSKVAELLAE